MCEVFDIIKCVFLISFYGSDVLFWALFTAAPGPLSSFGNMQMGEFEKIYHEKGQKIGAYFSFFFEALQHILVSPCRVTPLQCSEAAMLEPQSVA